MGLGGISVWQLLIVLVIVVLLFGTKRLSTLGTDLGSAIRGFRKSMNPEEEDKARENERLAEQKRTGDDVIDAESQRTGDKH